MPPDVRADLIRDGVAPQRLGPGGTLVVTRGAPGPGRPVARFGDGSDALAVSRTEPDAGREAAVSAAWGRQLLDNPAVRVEAPARRRAARTGRPTRGRCSCSRSSPPAAPCTCSTSRPCPAEDPGLPRHQVVLSGLDAQALAWVRAQRPPFIPLVMTAGDTTALAWAVPAPSGLLGP